MFFLIIFILINQLNTIDFTLKKNISIDNEFCPYTLNFTLNNNTFQVYPAIIDTTQSYILTQEEQNNNSSDINNIIINYYENNNNYLDINISGTIFHYFKAKEKLIDKGYLGIIGISNKNRYKNSYINNNNWHKFSYLHMLKQEYGEIQKYINFIQKEDDEALIEFGDINPVFQTSTSRRCSCNNIFWSCELSSLKIGGNEIYPSSSNEYAIFSISEEFIIAPRYQGNKTLVYYKNLIQELFGEECNLNYTNKNNLANLTCPYFNYEDLPDLSFVMKGGIKIMALSIDLFKILNDFSLELKIKFYMNREDNNWYLGEPVIKNYNLLLNYTDEENAELIIIPSSLNGFILIIVACVGGFLFLFLFLTIIYCASKNDKKSKKRKSYFSGWGFGKKNSDIFFMAKNSYIQEKIEENEDEDIKSEGSEDSEKSDNKSDNSKSGSIGSDDRKNVEEKKLDEDEEEEIMGSGLINENYEENNNVDNLIINNINNINNTNDINNENNNNNKTTNNQNNHINVELSINNYDDEDNEDEKELMIKDDKDNNK
jgi:hypothetical protein